MKAYERHRLKEDKYVATVVWLAAKCRKYQKPLAGVVVVLLAATAIVVWTVASRRSEEKAAAAALSEVGAPADKTRREKDEEKEEAVKAAVSKYKQIASDYPATDAAPMALLQAAQLLAGAGKHKEAVGCFERALDLGKDLPGLVALAKRGLAARLEESGRVEAAISHYRDLEEKFGPAERARASWDIGRCYETLGSRPKAESYYRQCITHGAGSAWAELARSRLAALSAPAAKSVEAAKAAKSAAAPPKDEPIRITITPPSSPKEKPSAKHPPP